jgi:hypothetical protein
MISNLQEQAKELIDLGNSREKAEGYGMMRVIDQIKELIINIPNDQELGQKLRENIWKVLEE